VTTDPALRVAGNQNLTENLLAEVRHAHKDLSHISLQCRNTLDYPRVCTMAALWTLEGEPTVPVAGTVSAFGIYTRTDTYAIQLVYHQTGGPALHKPPNSSQAAKHS
jgi:hypothetical protein